MPDEDIEKLREQKRKELEQQQESQEQQIEEQRKAIKQKASQYLTDEARSRLGNVRVARPEVAQSVEMQIAQLGERGAFQKVTDSDLKEILQDIQKDKDDSKGNISFRRWKICIKVKKYYEFKQKFSNEKEAGEGQQES